MEDINMLEECPICRGPGVIMHECGWSVQVECADCSAHTIYMEYNNDAEKAEAERKNQELLKELERLKKEKEEAKTAPIPPAVSTPPTPKALYREALK